MSRKIISAAAIVGVFAVTAMGVFLFNGARWDIAAVIAAFLCCVPFFLSFEKRAPMAREVVLVAAMTAFSVAGRFVFAVIPFFKPVTAIVVISAMYFGAQAGFMTGAMSALISNIYFGQGAWTPFQMLCWGLIGFAAGLLNRKNLLEKPVPLCVYAVLAGALYSVMMDIWTVLSVDGTLDVTRWIGTLYASLPITACYCVSNAIFLLILRKPLGRKLKRLKTKFGVFCEDGGRLCCP